MSYVAIPYLHLLIAASMLVVAWAISWREGLGMGSDIAIGGVRAFLQLTAMGFVLGALFRHPEPGWVLLLLAVMLAVAAWNAAGRLKSRVPGLRLSMLLAIGFGASIPVATVILLVLQVKPWYQPQYIVPVAGMILGNAMSAAVLAGNRWLAELKLRRAEVEAALALGASPARASAAARREALRAAALPTVSAMMVVGVVQLPGMMTGQLIAGQDPGEAVRYQVVVMFMLSCGVTLASWALLTMLRKATFTSAEQLRPELF